MTRNANDNMLLKRLKKLEQMLRANPLRSASISEGRVRFIGGLLRVDSGGRVEIVGTLQIDGAAEVTGTFTVTGPWELQGGGTITGDVALTGDMNVSGAGRVNVGSNMTLTPSTDGGAVEFASGAKLSSASGYVGVHDGTGGFLLFNSSGATLTGATGPLLRVGPGGVSISGLPTVSVSLYPGSFPGAVVADSSGNLSRVV